MEDQIDLLEYLRYMLFINHLHKKIGHTELIDTDTFQGKGFDFRSHSLECPVVFAGDAGSGIFPKIESCQDGKNRLFLQFPILRQMGFKNYRLVGGACTSFLRSTGYTEDLDFFPLVERYDNESYSIREGRVQQVYVNFLQEVEHIHKTALADKYNFIVYRNEDCTTILMTLKVANSYNQKTMKKNMKLQFVHRAFDSESQMVLCSDLMASQVLFDGIRFRCTYAAMMSLKSNIIPVDFSSASTSMAYRLHKYACNKSFLLAFCGLDRVEIKALLKQKRAFSKANIEKRSKMTKHERSIRTQDELKQTWLESIILLPCGLTINKWEGGAFFPAVFQLGMDFHHKEKDSLGLAVAEADYSDYGGISNLEKGGELGEINVEAFLDGKSLHVYAREVASFLKSPIATGIRIPFSQLCHIKKDLGMIEIKRLFGTHAKDAVIAYFDKNEVAYRAVVNKRVAELREGMTPLFERLQRVKWRMVDPGAQAIGSMRPVKVTAREGYGDLYRSFICNYAWDLKMTIISAFKRKSQEKHCLLVQYLGRDMIKFIFLHVDVLYAEEQCVLYSSLCSNEDQNRVITSDDLAGDNIEELHGAADVRADDHARNSEDEQEVVDEYWRGAANDFDSYPSDDDNSYGY